MSVNNTKKPLILQKMIIKPKIKGPLIPYNVGKMNIQKNTLNNQIIKVATIPLFREDIIFESNGETYLPGEYRSITIINKLNNLNNNCKTIAKCVTLQNENIEKTSENLTNLIGQEAYNTLFYALCSVINQEYRIKGILSLLTVFNPPLLIPIAIPMKTETASQTDESRIELNRKKERRRVRKALTPHVVKPENFTTQFSPKIVNITTEVNKKTPDNSNHDTVTPKTESKDDSALYDHASTELDMPKNDLDKNLYLKSFKKEIDEKSDDTKDSNLPNLGYLQDETSNDSLKSNFSFGTFNTTWTIVNNPLSLINQDSIVENVEKHTKNHPKPTFTIVLKDKSEIRVPYKPEDMFHIATKENLEAVDGTTRNKLTFLQMQIDYQHCLTFRDEDGYLPIHVAVLNEDVVLLGRQCYVLKCRGETVDIPATNGSTALALSIEYHTSKQSVCMFDTLLRYGADPLDVDAAHRTALHRAAELRTDHLSTAVHRATQRVRELIEESVEDLQKPGWQERSDEELNKQLMEYISQLFDKQGDNPLMLACKHGHYANVRLLLEAAPSSVNIKNPNSGNTALFMAVAAACNLAAERGNKTKIVDYFRKTIELLLEFNADPTLENNNSITVNILLSEFGCAELSTLMANKVAKSIDSEIAPSSNCNKFHLFRQGNNVTIQEFKKSPKEKHGRPKKVNCEPDKKLVIVENILLKSPVTDKVKVEEDIVIKSEKCLKRPAVSLVINKYKAKKEKK